MEFLMRIFTSVITVGLVCNDAFLIYKNTEAAPNGASSVFWKI